VDYDWLQSIVAGGAFHMRVAAMYCSAVLLTGCASIPDVDYTYYPSKLNGVATVTETVTCNPDSKNIVVSSSAGFVPSYSADVQAGLRRIAIRRFEGTYASFADSDANFSFYDDGRLKSINQTTTGQGETIVKSLVSLGTSISSLAGAALADRNLTDGKKTTPCDVVKAWSGASKSADAQVKPPNPGPAPPAPAPPAPAPPAPAPPAPATDSKGLPSVTLTYRGELNASVVEPFHARARGFKAVGTSAAIRSALQDALGGSDYQPSKMPTYTLGIGGGAIANQPQSYSAAQSAFDGNYVNLELQTIAVADLIITADNRPIFRSNVLIPTPQSYYLPIPAAALFGAQKLVLSFAESGLVTQIDYSKNTGLAGAANAANGIVTAVTPESASAKASDVKAQADLLAQQARLHRCLTNPATCQ
jgi:hypothetical protein